MDEMLVLDCDLKQWIVSEGFVWVPAPNTPPEKLQDVLELCFSFNLVA